MKEVVVVSGAGGNLLSIKNALDYCGARVKVTHDLQAIKKASFLVLPGVGSFGGYINKLRVCGILDIIKEHMQQEKSFLGICVGMQILFSKGYEFGEHDGLNILTGDIKKIPSLNTSRHHIPHTGWFRLEKTKPLMLLENVANPTFYFTHSYYADTAPHNVTAYYQFESLKIPALVEKHNVFGCQFHPERSGKAGLQLLNNFLNV